MSMTTNKQALPELREIFERWWELNYHNGNPPRFGWESWRDGDGYKVDDDESELDGMWEAWQAAHSEKLEAAERRNAELHDLLFTEVSSWTQRYDCANSRREAAEKRIAELEAREVTLPAPYPKGYGMAADKYNFALEECSDAIRAAGISITTKGD